MNCPHSNNHCHACEKSKHWDFFFMVVAVAITVVAFWLIGWEVWKYIIWPWLFLAVLYGAKYFIDKEKKGGKKDKN